MRLKNKVAVITGAGRGIGFAAARAFVREGARVVIAEIDDALGKSAESVLRETGSRAAGEVVFIRTDCADAAAVRSLMARAEELYGGLHVLYNNASIFLKGADGPVTDLAEGMVKSSGRSLLELAQASEAATNGPGGGGLPAARWPLWVGTQGATPGRHPPGTRPCPRE